MTILFKSLDHEQIKSYVIQSFSSSNERFHPYNYYLAHLLARKKNADLKHYVSLDSTSVSPSSYSFLFDNLSQEDKNFAIDYYNQTTSSFDSSDLLYLSILEKLISFLLKLHIMIFPHLLVPDLLLLILKQ